MGENKLMDAAHRLRPNHARLTHGDVDARRVEAELRTTQALEDLDPGEWTVIKDLEWPGGRYGHVDHVVVGPSGVYVIDTTTWNGDVSVYGDRLRHEGVTQDSVVSSLTEAATAVDLLIPGVPQRLVKPVLCVDGSEGLDTQVGPLLVCSTDTLAAILEARVHSMSTHQISVADGQLRDYLHNRGVVKVAAREATRRPFVPMKGVPTIRIAIGTWFASVLILAPHTFTDAYTTLQDTVQRQVKDTIDKQRQIDQQQQRR